MLSDHRRNSDGVLYDVLKLLNETGYQAWTPPTFPLHIHEARRHNVARFEGHISKLLSEHPELLNKDLTRPAWMYSTQMRKEMFKHAGLTACLEELGHGNLIDDEADLEYIDKDFPDLHDTYQKYKKQVKDGLEVSSCEKQVGEHVGKFQQALWDLEEKNVPRW
jgi:hypothetical protein